jgi:hypothetical protein
VSKQRNIKKCNKLNCPGKMIQLYPLNRFFMELSDMKRLEEKIYPDKVFLETSLLKKCEYGIVNLKSIQKNCRVDYKKIFDLIAN